MKNQLISELSASISKASALKAQEIEKLIEKPKNPEFGDLAFPCFLLAKSLKCDPKSAAEKLKTEILLPKSFSEVNQVGPFLNFRFDRTSFIKNSFSELQKEKVIVRREKIIVEYSSPNIAKPFHVGHLRTTLIGNALDRIYRKLGYQTISINHLGDWGTQFGFVWAGCELWGKPEKPSVKALVELYKKATSLKERQAQDKLEQGEKDLPDVNEMARSYFVDLENGKEYAVKFWQMCLDVSLDYLKAAYKRLNVSFDHYTGESFYSDKLEAVQTELKAAGLLVESQGALGVDLGEKLGFARTYTPDGRSLYLARDIATVFYRKKEFNFDKILYVVGIPQTLHFQQLVEVLRKLGKDYAEKIEHVGFGHVMGMKTRGEAGVIELDEFLDEAYERALKAYHEQVSKRPEGVDDKLVAKAVALAAIVFSNLNKTRTKDVQFSWDSALAFQGDSGPYLLYAYARINSMREKAREAGIVEASEIKAELLGEDSAYQLVSLLDDFETALEHTVADNEPAHLCAYLLDVAKAMSKAYLDLKVLAPTTVESENAKHDANRRDAPRQARDGAILCVSEAERKELAANRLALFSMTQKVLGEGIRSLGLEPLERM